MCTSSFQNVMAKLPLGVGAAPTPYRGFERLGLQDLNAAIIPMHSTNRAEQARFASPVRPHENGATASWQHLHAAKEGTCQPSEA